MILMHPKFQAGQYRAVAEELLDSPAATRRRYVASLVGALSFLGRLEEAEDIFELEAKKTKNAVDAVAARFFLAIGFTRRSEYAKAQRLIEENEKRANHLPLAQFFVEQGKVFFLFYTGRLPASLRTAEAARKAAMASEDSFARALATDSLGHVQVRLGQIHRGLSSLAEAEKLARRVGNESMASAIAISRDLYSAEFGIEEDPVAKLEARWAASGPENNYSQANVGLELARQFTLRGNYAAAASVLEKTAPLIYANQNRRHEIQLNLRLAELAGRRGSFFQARHYLWFSRRLINQEVDSSLELHALGIEAKLAGAEGKIAEEADARARASLLGDRFPSARDQNLRARVAKASAQENPEDRVHLVLKASFLAQTLEKELEPLLHAGYLSEASLRLRLNPALPTLAVLPGKLGLLTQGQEGITWRPNPLSPLQLKILRLFQAGAEPTKETMVEQAWGYNYDSLRHDGMIHAALSALRRALGPAGLWLNPTQNGYRFEGTLSLKAVENTFVPAQPPSIAPAIRSDLNFRQLEILEWLEKSRYGSVKDCQDQFGVSEATALRDLTGLWKQGAVLRVGKARATRYCLAPRESQ